MEFALVLPILVLLLALAIDLGRVFFGWVSINNAARVGASYAAENADAWGTPSDVSRQDRYVTLVENDLQALNCTLQGVPAPNITDSDGSGTYDTGEPVEVTLDCTFDLITPLGTSIVGAVDLSGSATFPVHYTVRTALPPPPPPPPAPTCTVPVTVGQSRNAARSLWDDASFQPGNLVESGSGNFTVATQSVPANTQLDCAAGTMTIAAASGPSPVPTPTPTPGPACAAPVANFTATPQIGKSPLTVRFTDASTTSAGCPITAWSWSFESGSSTLQNPTHVFTHSGNGQQTKYRISLTVTTAGGTATETKNNFITATK